MSSDTDLFLIDELVLKGRVIPAISDFLDRSDPTAAKQLVQEAVSTRQFQATLASGATGDKITAEYLATGSKDLLDGKVPKEIVDDKGETIRDREAIRRRQTEATLGPLLVFFICSWSRDGVHNHVSLSRGRLVDYLRSQSQWMDEILGSSNELLWNAPDMPLSIGGEAKILTQAEARTLLSRLQEVPPPHGQDLISQYELLREFLQIAVEGQRFRVLIRST